MYVTSVLHGIPYGVIDLPFALMIVFFFEGFNGEIDSTKVRKKKRERIR